MKNNPPSPPPQKSNYWDKLPGESAKAFQAFTIYRDLGPNRSRQQVSKALKKSEALMSRWAQNWSWSARCDAYDRHLDQQKQVNIETRLAEIQKEHLEVSHAFSTIVRAGLNKILTDLQNDILPEATTKELIDIYDKVVKIQRISAGLPENEPLDKEQGEGQGVDIKKLSTETLEIIERELKEKTDADHGE